MVEVEVFTMVVSHFNIFCANKARLLCELVSKMYHSTFVIKQNFLNLNFLNLNLQTLLVLYVS